MSYAGFFDDDRLDGYGVGTIDPDADRQPATVAEEPPAPGRRWRRLLAGAGLVVLTTGVVATSLAWNGASSRADRLAARLTSSRAELARQNLEASNLRLEVGNLKADKEVLRVQVDELQGAQFALEDQNESLTTTNEKISDVVKQLDQCLTDIDEIGGQLLRNPSSVPESRIRSANANCNRAQAAARVLKALTVPDAGKAV